LRKGEIQQVATPRELYEHPVNMFVAGFIGSPPMNFVPAEAIDGQLKLPFVTFDLPQEMREAVGDRHHVMVGIRPERFEDNSVLDSSQVATGVTFSADVEVIEWLGNEQYAYIPYDAAEELTTGLSELEKELDSERMRSQLVVALDPASAITDRSTAEIWFDPRHLHIFDAESGDNLTNAVAATPAAAT
jgi:multiple sugar transport system ATP-binding protein